MYEGIIIIVLYILSECSIEDGGAKGEVFVYVGHPGWNRVKGSRDHHIGLNSACTSLCVLVTY